MAGAPKETASLDDGEMAEQSAFTEINIVPLVDIMLVLLVILMATSTAILEAGQGQGSGFKVNLPTGSESDEVASLSDELVVAILADGTVLARGEQVSQSELETIFADEAKKNASKVVLVQADEQTMHKRVVEVMEAARKAGLQNLAIATKPEVR
jgi:biopolymer transport protein ExbD